MSEIALEPGFELVHFVTAFYDFPREGVADYRGQPHHFNCPDRIGDPADLYELTPLSAQLFEATVGLWDIWLRCFDGWNSAKFGPMGPNPALPEDRERQAALELILTSWLESSRSSTITVFGYFSQLLPEAACGMVRGALQVRWTEPTFAGRVCRLPRAFTVQGAPSMVELVEASGYTPGSAEVTKDAILAVLRREPSLVDDWLTYSVDKRTPSGWYISSDGSSTKVAFFPEGPAFTFSDSLEACAEFIVRELEALAAQVPGCT